MNALVRMVDIDKSFPGVHALRKAQFELVPGEVHALMGENGAGKSTLMKILAGIHPPTAGKIFLDGVPAQLASPRAAQNLGITIIHQELNLMPDLTTAQNIFIGREPLRAGFLLNERRQNADAKTIFDGMWLDLDPYTLAGGLTVARQQMVEIAKALSFRSRVLIMDEPTAALNDAEITELFAVIARLKADGVGIVYISHKMDELKRIADRVTVMRDGEYVATLPMAETPVSHIISLMVGRVLVEETTPRLPDQEGEVLLDVRHLSRGTAVRDVSFSVRRGEILGFAGLMGAGRTEVARAVFGADARDSGEIRVGGQLVEIRTPRDAVRAGIGYLSEDRKQFGLATDMSVRDNIAMASLGRFSKRAGILDERAMRETARSFISKLAIRTPSDKQEARLLSGGNQQKVVIAKWLLRDCDVLFFDEPTRGIDVGAKAEIYKLLNQLAAEGRAIIVISSELPEVLRLSHRIAVMCEGRLTGFLPAGANQDEIMQLATQRQLSTLMGNAG